MKLNIFYCCCHSHFHFHSHFLLKKIKRLIIVLIIIILLYKMEFQNIVSLLDITSDDKDLPRYVTKKWIEVYDQSEKNYNINKEIKIKTPILRSDLCDFSDAYIVVKGDITVTNPNNAKRNKSVTFKNNAPFINCITKINDVKFDNAEDLDVVISMYNLLEYSKNYKKTT